MTRNKFLIVQSGGEMIPKGVRIGGDGFLGIEEKGYCDFKITGGYC